MTILAAFILGAVIASGVTYIMYSKKILSLKEEVITLNAKTKI